MKLSTKSRYAVRALLNLALNYKGEPLQIRTIAKDEKISARYLENIFTALRAAGILLSAKGKGGGFLLAKDPSEINLLDVIKVIEGDLSIVECVNIPSNCKHAPICVARDVWLKLSDNLKQALKTVTLKDLIISHKKKLNIPDKSMYYRV